MKQKELRTFYLLTLPPLFLFSLILLFFDPDYLDSALFAFGYSFVLVGWTPYVDELVRTRKYRMSFLRLSFSLTKNVIKYLNIENKPIYCSLVRTFLPMILILIMMALLKVNLGFYYCLIGSAIAEGLILVLKRHLPKEILRTL
jgi:hypothetical protein